MTSPSALDPTVRRDAGTARRDRTRRRLLAAADELFREHGYGATTVTAIAARADVSLQTLYLVWGSKRALLLAATAATAVAADLPVAHEEWRRTVEAQLAAATGPDPDARTHLRALVGLWVSVAERTAPYWRMTREAAVSEPDVADFWRVTEAERRRTMTELAAATPSRGLRPGTTTADVADALWALASPEVHDLVTQDGRTSAQYGAWLEGLLTAALCTPGTGDGGGPPAAGR